MKQYNTTHLDPEQLLKNGVLHRDYLAHAFRWGKVAMDTLTGEKICDFGCGPGFLAEILWRNRVNPGYYLGFDIRQQIIAKAASKYANLNWAQFVCLDLIKDTYDFAGINADKVTSFEVLEHVGRQNADSYLQRFKECGHENATYYLSTPNYDTKVGAADNHTYDSGDGRGVAVHEFTHAELQALLEKHFTIVKKFGTFASVGDYKPLLNDWQRQMYEGLKEYYEPNMLANIMAPFFPEQSRNTLWILKRKPLIS